jgi:hypothetical protein
MARNSNRLSTTLLLASAVALILAVDTAHAAHFGGGGGGARGGGGDHVLPAFIQERHGHCAWHAGQFERTFCRLRMDRDGPSAQRQSAESSAENFVHHLYFLLWSTASHGMSAVRAAIASDMYLSRSNAKDSGHAVGSGVEWNRVPPPGA